MSFRDGMVRRCALGCGVAAGLLAFAACEVPEAPEWDVGVIAPFSSDPVAIVDFLPSAVDTATVDGVKVFTIEEQTDSIDYSLGEMCTLCAPLAGQTVPVPGFDFVDSLTVAFTQDLFSLEIQSARLGIVLRNGLDFDPLRPDPDPGSAGFIAVAIHDLASGTLLDSVMISGTTDSFPRGATRTLEFAVEESEISEGVRTVIYLHSLDDGQTGQVDLSDDVFVGTFLSDIQVSAVTAFVDGEALDESFVVDVDAEARQEIAGRAQEATYELELIHELELSGNLEASIAGAPSDLFSGDALREVRLSGLSLESGVVQTGSLAIQELQLIAGFPEVLVGYRAVASGTRQRFGRDRLSRFTADQEIDSRLTVVSRIRVGE